MIVSPYLQCKSPLFHGLWYLYLSAWSLVMHVPSPLLTQLCWQLNLKHRSDFELPIQFCSNMCILGIFFGATPNHIPLKYMCMIPINNWIRHVYLKGQCPHGHTIVNVRFKVDVPKSNLAIIWTLVSKWYVISCESKNNHPKWHVFKREWATCS